jgi:hypothetical protein
MFPNAVIIAYAINVAATATSASWRWRALNGDPITGSAM